MKYINHAIIPTMRQSQSSICGVVRIPSKSRKLSTTMIGNYRFEENPWIRRIGLVIGCNIFDSDYAITKRTVACVSSIAFFLISTICTIFGSKSIDAMQCVGLSLIFLQVISQQFELLQINEIIFP